MKQLLCVIISMANPGIFCKPVRSLSNKKFIRGKFGLLVSFLAFIFFFNLMFSACKSSSKPTSESLSTKQAEEFIDMDNVTKDSLTGLFVFKNNGEKVTGTVVHKHWDESVIEDSVILKVIIENGVAKQINDYYLNGSLYKKYSNNKRKIERYSRAGKLLETIFLNRNNQDSIRYSHTSNGSISMIVIIDREKKEKIVKDFENDLQSKETIYNENDEVIKSYDFDEYGHKILKDIDKLELLKYQTGFYRYADYNKDQVLYQPMVLMKWKNISDEALTKDIKITGVFISGSEEWSTDDSYFQTSYGTPLQSGLARQANVTSSVGFTSPAGINGANIKCQIYINNQLYKTIKIQNKLLHTNRIQ